MGLVDIREQIKATLSSVDGVGIVHDYERWASTWQKFLELFKDADGKINGWVFSRVAMAKVLTSTTGEEKAHIFRFMGVRGLSDDDATGVLFDDLIEDIVDAFAVDDTLGGTCEYCTPEWGPMEGKAGMQTEKIEVRKFGSVLCHYGELKLCAIEYAYT